MLNCSLTFFLGLTGSCLGVEELCSRVVIQKSDAG